MTWEKPLWEQSIPVIAASNIVPYVPVKDVAGTKDNVVLCATDTDRAVAVTYASAGQGEPLTTIRKGVAPCLAAASLGANAEVAVGTANGGLTLAAAASGVDTVAIGVTKHAAAAGEVVAVDLTFRSLQTGGG